MARAQGPLNKDSHDFDPDLADCLDISTSLSTRRPSVPASAELESALARVLADSRLTTRSKRQPPMASCCLPLRNDTRTLRRLRLSLCAAYARTVSSDAATRRTLSFPLSREPSTLPDSASRFRIDRAAAASSRPPGCRIAPALQQSAQSGNWPHAIPRAERRSRDKQQPHVTAGCRSKHHSRQPPMDC
jgi:hypothetical protein